MHVYLLLSLSLFYIVFLRCALAYLIPHLCRFSVLHSVFSCIPSALHSWDVFMCDTSHRLLFYCHYISATPTVQWYHTMSAYAAHVVCCALHYSTIPAISLHHIKQPKRLHPIGCYMMLGRYSLSCALSVSHNFKTAFSPRLFTRVPCWRC